jgi:hypothetical protein
MLRALFVRFVSEDPLGDTLRYFRLAVFIRRNTRRGKKATIVIAAGLRAMFIDRTLAVDEHRALPPVVVAHE